MIESANTPGIYYILPGERVGAVTERRPGWYIFINGNPVDGPYETEADAEYTQKHLTSARLYRDKDKK